MFNIESSTKPFLKWAGGKAKLVSQIRAHIPSTWNPKTDLYIEPFLGGGAMFFALQPKNAILNDANDRLIQTYTAIRDQVESVIGELAICERRHQQQGAVFYQAVRAKLSETLPSATFAAYFIFLNKAGFNGLYRVNKANEFNVPWGKNPNVTLCDPEKLRLCSAALRGVSLVCGDFGAFAGVTGWAKPLIYCDPPYVPVSKTANFTAYTAGGFTYADQIRLLARAVEWRRQGAHVILSQAAAPTLLEQYTRCGFQYEIVQARRNINSKGASRGPVNEYIIF